MPDNYIEGGAMGHTSDQLKELHDFAEDYRREQSNRRERVMETYTHHINELKKTYDSNQDDFREIHQVGKPLFLVIQKTPGSLVIALTTDENISLVGHDYKNKIDGIEKLEIAHFDSTTKKLETVYGWDKDALKKQYHDNVFYGHAISKFETRDIENATADQKDTLLENVGDLIEIKQTATSQV